MGPQKGDAWTMAELRKVDSLHICSMTWKWHTAYYSFIFHSNYTNSAESFFVFRYTTLPVDHCQFNLTSSICQAFIYPDGERFESPEEQDRKLLQPIYLQMSGRLVQPSFFGGLFWNFGCVFGGMTSFCAVWVLQLIGLHGEWGQGCTGAGNLHS